MANNDNLVEVLNDLIRINNDRIEGYNRGAKEAQANDVDLKEIFSKMADESRQYLSELTREVVKLGGEPASGTTTSGKIYRTWMDVKATFTGNDRLAVLSNCEFGEDAAQKAYQEALTTDETLPTDIRQMIANQKASLKVSHDTIKKLRDTQRNAKADNWSTGSDSGFGGSSTGSVSGSGTTGSTGSLNDDDLRGSGLSGGTGNLGNL
jgi:uncharacterized protein (TIGR02284 family)